MSLITVAWIAFGLGTTLGFLVARSVEDEQPQAPPEPELAPPG